MLFKYKAVDEKGINREGQIDAPSRDVAISGLQGRGLIVVGIKEEGEKTPIFKKSLFGKVKTKDVVVLSRQIATLFEAQVSALKAFTLLAANTENKILKRKLTQISDDLQAGVSISGALSKHPDVFSDFYVNLVKAGEETGKLNQTFNHLADYLDRQYALTSKTRNALIYPIFVIFTFIAVMILMFVVVIPKMSAIINESGQAVPFFTKLIIGLSNFFMNYGFIIVIFLALGGIWLWRLSATERGKEYLDKMKLSLPAIGDLYQKLYLSRMADNMDTMLTSGIPIVRAIDITGEVVGNKVFQRVLKDTAEGVKSGLSFSAALEKHPEIPNMMTQMVKVGEETGSLGSILKTMGDFYKREVDGAVDTLVGLIEPFMIIFLGVGVGILLVSILMPIYNIAGGIA
ncbi:MAG TPA: type II secretion system F family protein [Candidatus Paceibacterota bacterium]|nr:type II secretion system F family protein [Candidatus Paceibacterota bacterium]